MPPTNVVRLVSGRVVIPKHIRELVNLAPDAFVQVVPQEDGTVLIVPVEFVERKGD